MLVTFSVYFAVKISQDIRRSHQGKSMSWMLDGSPKSSNDYNEAKRIISDRVRAMFCL